MDRRCRDKVAQFDPRLNRKVGCTAGNIQKESFYPSFTSRIAMSMMQSH